MTTSSDEIVLATNNEFYRAFNARDLPAMESLWAEKVPVACIHPGWRVLRSRESVMNSWRDIFRGGGTPKVTPGDAHAVIVGDAAFVTCYERIEGGSTLIATNVFAREGVMWRMIHHQAGPLANEPRRTEIEVDPLPSPPTPSRKRQMN